MCDKEYYSMIPNRDYYTGAWWVAIMMAIAAALIIFSFVYGGCGGNYSEGTDDIGGGSSEVPCGGGGYVCQADVGDYCEDTEIVASLRDTVRQLTEQLIVAEEQGRECSDVVGATAQSLGECFDALAACSEDGNVCAEDLASCELQLSECDAGYDQCEDMLNECTCIFLKPGNGWGWRKHCKVK